MSRRLAALAALAFAASSFTSTASAEPAACIPRAAGYWCFDGSDPTDVPCIEGNFDPLWVRLIECPS